MRRRLNEEKGIILPIVLIFALVLMITGLVFVSLPVQENSLVRKEIAKRQAFYLAEAGVEDARAQLGQNWDDCTTIDTTLTTSLGEGTYHAEISESSENREVTSTGTVTADGTAKKVGVILKPHITSAIEAGGKVNVIGHATVNGDIEQNSTSFEDPDAYFKEVFGVSKTEMKEKAQNPPNRYYNGAINNDPVDNITWVDGGGEWSQIQAGWAGNGIFIVNGDLKITGNCTFDGIIWVTGTLTVAAGTAEINGAVFVESATTVDLSGNLTLTYDLDEIMNALGGLGSTAFGDLGSKGVIVESWEEL